MAQKMISLKMTPKDAKSEYGGECAAPGSIKDNLPKYPYDTKVRLNTELLEKLGVSPTDFKVGDKLQLIANVEVAGTSMNERMGGKERNEVELQMTELCLDTSKAKKAKTAAERLNALGGSTKED